MGPNLRGGKPRPDCNANRGGSPRHGAIRQAASSVLGTGARIELECGAMRRPCTCRSHGLRGHVPVAVRTGMATTFPPRRNHRWVPEARPQRRRAAPDGAPMLRSGPGVPLWIPLPKPSAQGAFHASAPTCSSRWAGSTCVLDPCVLNYLQTSSCPLMRELRTGMRISPGDRLTCVPPRDVKEESSWWPVLRRGPAVLSTPMGCTETGVRRKDARPVQSPAPRPVADRCVMTYKGMR